MINDEHAGVMASRFTAQFGKVDRTARKARERKSTRTPKERQRASAARSELVNFKTTFEMRTLLKTLAKENNLTMTAVIEEGIRLFANTRRKGKNV